MSTFCAFPMNHSIEAVFVKGFFFLLYLPSFFCHAENGSVSSDGVNEDFATVENIHGNLRRLLIFFNCLIDTIYFTVSDFYLLSSVSFQECVTQELYHIYKYIYMLLILTLSIIQQTFQCKQTEHTFQRITHMNRESYFPFSLAPFFCLFYFVSQKFECKLSVTNPFFLAWQIFESNFERVASTWTDCNQLTTTVQKWTKETLVFSRFCCR